MSPPVSPTIPPPPAQTMPDDSGADCSARALLRRGVYAILIALSVGGMVGRILAVNAVDKIGVDKTNQDRQIALRKQQLKDQGQPVDDEAVAREVQEHFVGQQRPFLSANDRSRWDTIRALVENGTYAIDDIQNESGWDTIDMVRHRGADGQWHLYSSKPTLLTTLLAGQYWLIHHATGASLKDHPYEVGRFMLIAINVLPLILYFWLLARLAERYGQTDWGRIFVMAAATGGTFITTFSVVLNNHVTGAVTVLIAVYAALRIWHDSRREWYHFGLSGLFAAFTASDELPALCFLAILTAGLLWRFPRQTLLYYMPPVLIVMAGFFGTNYIAHQSFRPPYMHRHDVVGNTVDPDDWYHFDYMRGGKLRPAYWNSPVGIDKGEPTIPVYALHALVGHHGIFSLTPVWLLALPGVVMLGWWRRYRLRELAILIGGVTIICVTFYIAIVKPLDRNYGGMTSGLRWVFWLAPLWLIAMLPAADWLSAARWRRGVGYVLLALSALSASYPTWNPWVQPWLANFFVYLGWTHF